MRAYRVAALCVMVGAAGLGGCANQLQEENAMLQEEVTALRDQLGQRNDALDAANQELRQRQQRVAQLERDLRDAQREAEAAEPAEQPGFQDGFEGIEGVTGASSPGRVTATIESDILFRPGQDSLRQDAQRTLNEVANVLNSEYAGREIQVIGHTDQDPIRVSGHESNYHLGFKRAYSVFEYLMEQGVTRERMSLASYGPHDLRGTKERSRRVEIVVLVD